MPAFVPCGIARCVTHFNVLFVAQQRTISTRVRRNQCLINDLIVGLIKTQPQ